MNNDHEAKGGREVLTLRDELLRCTGNWAVILRPGTGAWTRTRTSGLTKVLAHSAARNGTYPVYAPFLS